VKNIVLAGFHAVGARLRMDPKSISAVYLDPERRDKRMREMREKLIAAGVRVMTADIMGKTEKQHLKLTFDCGKFKWPAIFWQAAERLNRDFAVGDVVDAVFQVGRNTFNGAETPQMILEDVQRASARRVSPSVAFSRIEKQRRSGSSASTTRFKASRFLPTSR
jgi:hypothetical protein